MPSRDHRGGVVLLSLAPLSECLLPRIADGAGRRHPKSIQSTFAVVQRRWQNAPAPIRSPRHCRAEAMVLWHQSADTHTPVATVGVEVEMDVTLAAGVATQVTVAPP